MIADPEFLGLSKAYRRVAYVRFGSIPAIHRPAAVAQKRPVAQIVSCNVLGRRMWGLGREP